VTNVSSNTVTVDVANIGTVSGVIRFNHLPSSTVADASAGFPLKVKILTSTAKRDGDLFLVFLYQLDDDQQGGDVPPWTMSLSQSQ
jgi:hypothetical protein